MKPHGETLQQYVDFAVHAREESPCFEQWARGVADDPEVLAWIDRLPGIKRQPNLVFAAARWHGVPAPGPYAGLRAALLDENDPTGATSAAIRATILERATQTNEVGRLATLVPVLATLPGPLALLEVGTSAGLCLYPDRYDYAWPPLGRLDATGGPVLTSYADGPVPVPTRPLEVAWRGGVDLHPLDVRDPDATAWLETLVWPRQDERRRRLNAAIEVARADPPDLVTGDLLAELPGLLDEAGEHGTVVVFHSAAVAYLDDDQRRRFATTMRELVAEGRCHWVSNEAPGVVPGIESSPDPGERFLLALDGRQVAWAHGHGTYVSWL